MYLNPALLLLDNSFPCILGHIGFSFRIENIQVLWYEMAIVIGRLRGCAQLLLQPMVQVCGRCLSSTTSFRFVLPCGCTVAFPATTKLTDCTSIGAAKNRKGYIVYVRILHKKLWRNMPPFRTQTSSMWRVKFSTMTLKLAPLPAPLHSK